MGLNNIEEKVNYCLGCKARPCALKGCPLGNNIPEFIKLVKEENYKQAYEILSKTTVLPAICGKVCPHKKQCQGSCVRRIKGEPVDIGDIEAFIFDKSIEQGNSLLDCYKEGMDKSRLKNKKVAVIGGGPTGLTCSSFLAKEGVQVTIYEKYDYLGGLLIHGIPEFRLSKETVQNSVDRILELGINVKYNQELGKNITLEELKKEYDSIFLSIGANVSSKMNIEGEELEGVYGGNELLEYNIHPDYKEKTALIIGGGNVAMDCARTIKKLGAKEVKVVYRRAREQMPAESKEIEEALEEGVEFLFQNNIVKIIGNEKVEKVELIRTSLIKPNKEDVLVTESKGKENGVIKTKLLVKEGETRAVPVNIEGSNYIIDADYIVMALGSKPANFVKRLNLELDKWGSIQVDEEYRTSDSKVYSGGDIAGVKSTVAWAAYSGREAAKSIIKKLEQI